MAGKGSNVGTLLFGIALGAAAGVLFAPRNGKETRKQLKVWLDEQREAGSEAVEKFRKELPAQRERIAATIKRGTDVFTRNGRKKTTPAKV